MNKLDTLIETLAYDLFNEQGFVPKLIEYKIKELQICVKRGYNTRAEIISLIKHAKEQN